MGRAHVMQIGSKMEKIFEDQLTILGEGCIDNVNLRSRCLSAYAVYISNDCSKEDACRAVIDDSRDNGIDAIHYCQTSKKLVIVQSKFSQDGSGEPDRSGILKFLQGVRDLYNFEFDRFNTKFEALKENIKFGLDDFGAKCQLIFIDTHSRSELVHDSSVLINDILKEFNGEEGETSQEVMNFTRYYQDKIYKSLAQENIIDIDLELSIENWSRVEEPYEAYYGLLNGKVIAELWSQYNTQLLSKNIRSLLGETPVNRNMINTLKENPKKFWYYNNGITIVADSLGSNMSRTLLKLSNASIVNGAQTFSTIGKTDIETLNDVFVSCRIISLESAGKDFGENVTKNNNRQNKIEDRDFASLDKEQVRIKDELSFENVEYKIMRSEDKTVE